MVSKNIMQVYLASKPPQKWWLQKLSPKVARLFPGLNEDGGGASSGLPASLTGGLGFPGFPGFGLPVVAFGGVARRFRGCQLLPPGLLGCCWVLFWGTSHRIFLRVVKLCIVCNSETLKMRTTFFGPIQ